MKISKILLINFFSLFVFLNFVSAEGLMQIRSRAWPTKVTLGDEIKLSIRIDRPRGFSITPPSPKTSISPFEIKSVEVADYSEEKQIVRQTFLAKVTVFQLGDLQIPPMPIQFTDQRGHTGQAWTEPIKIKVSSVIKNPKDKAGIRPIKGPVSMDTRTAQALVLSMLALVLFVTLAVKVILRLRHKEPLDPESLKPAHERAMLELGRLEARALLSEGKAKEFYSELADILRRYLDRRFQMETLELTTFEILKNLKENEFDVRLTEKIKELLEHSDLVKFAKFIPPRSSADTMTGLLKEVVEKTIPWEEGSMKK